MTDERIKEELKPCPFCGSVEHLEIVHADELRDDDCTSYNGDAYTVVCNYLTGGCGANCGFVTAKNETAKKWNTRAADLLAARELIKEMREEINITLRDFEKIDEVCRIANVMPFSLTKKKLTELLEKSKEYV